ncbi:iron(III) transport system substrate-binding protein [Luteibacter rhizovicinus]|uniref:Iron(III) transport system substrate-binding protein n=1 Tax=Luteibacter rhizovicinus TaxID=242606 RepID=A0A4R3YSS7_9GAMM|nr:extracellular solute-binding protein [Luteibacter rhizovicinus]TCV94768.1 iron(III) transport system substrate-binding protein [Luteibacter rhizovicinus]
MHVVRKLMLVLAAFLASGGVNAGDLTVYSALESDEIAVYLKAAHIALPDIDVHILRLSSGDLAARLLAESAEPRTDVVWGMALTDMLDPRIARLFAPVAGANIDTLPARFRGANWFAATGYMAALCVNTQALAEQHLPVPHTWADLTRSVYRGQIAMPDPASSGTGYMVLSTLIDSGHRNAGWPLVEGIARNLGQITLSGSNPCKLARIGEFPIGISFAFVAMQSIRQGYPIAMVLPADATGYELEASGQMKGASHARDAQRFLDWTASPDAAALYRQYKEIVAAPGVGPSSEQRAAGLPADVAGSLPPRDFARAARDRASIITRWKRLSR